MKIVVSIMPRSLDEAQSIDVTKFEQADLIEWRADVLPKDDILRVAPAIFEKFLGREVIFTVRTHQEGGFISLTPEEYVALLTDINNLYQPDYIDFEYFSYPSVFEKLLDFPNLVLSYHNLEETPDNIMEIFSQLTALSPRVVKLAVMPKTEQDVLDVMNYTRGFKTLNPEQSYAVMAMGKLGRLSRLAADVMGSCWSFASLDETSGPGQIALGHLVKIREILDEDRIGVLAHGSAFGDKS